MSKLYTLFLSFTPQNLEPALGNLDQILTRCTPGTQNNIIIINNSDKTIDTPLKTIKGDNSLFDFSGYQKGLDYIVENYALNDNDLVLLVNDSFSQNFGNLQYNLLQPSAFEFSPTTAIGFLDDFPNPSSIDRISYKYWIRANFICLSYRILKYLNCRVVHDLDPKKIFSQNPEEFWNNKTSVLAPNFKDYISTWLFGVGHHSKPEYQLTWYKSEPFKSSKKDFFMKKASSIICEHYLSARLKDVNVKVQSFNPLLKYSDRHRTDLYEQMDRIRSHLDYKMEIIDLKAF